MRVKARNKCRNFNSQPHKEVDKADSVQKNVDAVFQLTTSQGGRRMRLFLFLALEEFQLTTSQGGRRCIFSR